ncbi:MAG: penicillin acylase family protein [Ferruginibacter sp.]
MHKVFPKAPATDSAYFNNKDVVINEEQKPDRENGSNNWAVSGKKTKSGAPILCNDPHLGLNLPSLWYEVQYLLLRLMLMVFHFQAHRGLSLALMIVVLLVLPMEERCKGTIMK